MYIYSYAITPLFTNSLFTFYEELFCVLCTPQGYIRKKNLYARVRARKFMP